MHHQAVRGLAFGPPLSVHRIRTPFEGRGKTDGEWHTGRGRQAVRQTFVYRR